jgi:hypothetical protein
MHDRISKHSLASFPTRRQNIHPATRDIRLALATSATALALAGSGVAGAACTFSDPTTVVCTAGPYNAGLPGGSFVPVVDLTLVLDPGVTIDPAAGVAGVTANWGGDVTVTTSADISAAYADGVYLYGSASATLNNAGTIYAYVDNDNAVDISAYGNVDLVNSGLIQAEAYTGYAAIAVNAYSVVGDVSIQNSGTITADSASQDAAAVFAHATTGDISIDNAGTISAVTAASAAYGIEAYTTGDDGDIAIVDAGDIISSSNGVSAYGMWLRTFGDYADIDVSIASGASIDVDSVTYRAFGVYARALGAGSDVAVSNSGTVHVAGYYARGLVARTLGYASGYNDGSIVVDSGYRGMGMRVSGDAGADALNAGDITVNVDNAVVTYVPQGWGMAVSSRYGDVYAGNSGTISVSLSGEGYPEANALGIDAGSNYGDVVVSNSGLIQVDITAGLNDTKYQTSDAIGINFVDFYGAGTLHNSGTIDAIAVHGTAMGAFMISLQSLDVVNTGDIYAHSGDGANSGYGAFGLFSRASQDISIANGGSITAVADGGQYANADGIYLRLIYAADTSVDIANDGAISASADGAHAVSARAIYVLAGYIDISTGTGSSISATAGGNASALAIGISTDAHYAASVVNGGDIVVLNSDGDAYGIYAIARGDGELVVDNSGNIAAHADAYVHGIRAKAYGNGNLSISNDGAISATGDTLDAVGIQADIYGTGSIDVTVGATGSIDVHGHDSAAGIALSPYGGGTTSIDNQGDIYVYSAIGDALGIATLYGTGDLYIANGGAITVVAAAGSAYAIYANTVAGAAVVIDNTGTLTGAVFTGAGDDIFNNASTGTWNAIGSSNFGAGDDAIFNSGTINLQGATIDLGIDPAGNQFVNDGVVMVTGSNVIDMGTAVDLVTPNYYPFQNNGVVDFQDGAPDDSLEIIGDFAGDGDINLDVSGLHGTSDLLYIDGDVDPASTSTININLVDFPASSLVDAPMVEVTGSSTPGNFALGDLTYQPGFLDMQASLVSGTNSAGNASYALRFVPELSDAGELATLITPGVGLLMRDAVGTMEQRQSTSQAVEGQGRFSLWARVFYNAGWVEPGSGASFDMHTGGGESGFNFAANDRFGFGLILGRSELRQHLRDGVGSDSIKGNVYGGYGNMALPGGFSLDLSHRRLKFDAQIESGVDVSSGGEADTSSMEAGYRWMSKKNLGVQLQFQQTITRITSLDTIAGPVPFEGDSGRYSLTRLAGEVRKTWEPTPKGTIWVGRVLFNAIREFDGTSKYNVGDTLSGKTSLAGTSFRLEAGASAQRGHLLVYGSLSYEDGGVLHNFFGAHLGGRWVW